MNPTDLRWNIMPILVGAIGLIGAVFLGVFIGGSEMAKLVLIFGTAALIGVVAGMRQHIWILVPMCWGLTGSVYVLPLPFAVRDLVVMLVVATTFALLALRKFKFQNRWGLLDLILLLNLVQVGTVFALHPVGLRSLSSESVGARPYFNIVIAALAYLILSNQVISAKLSRTLPVLMFIPEAFTSLITLLVRIKPRLAYVVAPFYTGFLSPGMNNPNSPMQRIAIGSGNSLVALLCSYFRPLSLLSPFRPLRLLLFVIAIILVLISGFRSQLISVLAIFLIASYFRGGIGDLMTVFAGMIAAALTLVLINSIHPLPLSVQRTLSFLPGNWNSLARADAAGSTEWRLEMWREVPKSTKYIRDPIMGDGFGFNRAELAAMQRQLYSAGQISQEDFMLIGAFHNGPLSTVRFVGAVGLLLYYVLLIYLAMYAWRLIRAAEGTDIYPLALFAGLALIWEPINYTLVFGGYDSGFPNTIFGVGMLKMINNSLRAKQSETKSTAIPAQSPMDQAAAVLS